MVIDIPGLGYITESGVGFKRGILNPIWTSTPYHRLKSKNETLFWAIYLILHRSLAFYVYDGYYNDAILQRKYWRYTSNEVNIDETIKSLIEFLERS